MTFPIAPTPTTPRGSRSATTPPWSPRSARSSSRARSRSLAPPRAGGTIGGELFRNILAGEFTGAAYPVNRNGEPVAGVRGYGSVADIPDPVDLAVVCVPAAAVLEAVEAALDAGVRADLRDLGRLRGGGRGGGGAAARAARARPRPRGPPARAELPRHLVGRGHGSTRRSPPGRPRRATSASPPRAARSVWRCSRRPSRAGSGSRPSSRSGTRRTSRRTTCSSGGRTIPRPRSCCSTSSRSATRARFATLARRVARRKPILAVKSGTTASGARAASSHTAALAGSEAAVDALFHQAGVIRATSLEELIDVATLLSTQPMPRGRRVAVLTNAGGLGILCADACEAAGLELPRSGEETLRALAPLLPAEASLANPVDMLGSARRTRRTRPCCRSSSPIPGIDAVIALFVPAVSATADAVAAAIARAAAAVGRDKPVLAVVMSAEGIPAPLARPEPARRGVRLPESAARALGRAAERAEWLRRPLGTVPELEGVDRDAARSRGRARTGAYGGRLARARGDARAACSPTGSRSSRRSWPLPRTRPSRPLLRSPTRSSSRPRRPVRTRRRPAASRSTWPTRPQYAPPSSASEPRSSCSRWSSEARSCWRARSGSGLRSARRVRPGRSARRAHRRSVVQDRAADGRRRRRARARRERRAASCADSGGLHLPMPRARRPRASAGPPRGGAAGRRGARPEPCTRASGSVCRGRRTSSRSHAGPARAHEGLVTPAHAVT